MNFEWSTNSLTESYFTGVLFILLIAIIIFSRGKQEKQLSKQFFDLFINFLLIYFLFINIPSKLDEF